MINILIALTLFFSPDSLPEACDCPIPERFQPVEVNIDTLRYFHNNKQYKQGLVATLHFLNTDSTDLSLISWLGKFSFDLAEKLTNNKKIRNKKYEKNPYVRHKVIQDTVGYLTHESRKNYGPHFWGRKLQAIIGSYLLCSYQCSLAIQPGNYEEFADYIHILVAMRQFDRVKSEVKDFTTDIPSKRAQLNMGDRFMNFNSFYIGFGAYNKGLDFAQFVLNNFEVSRTAQRRWNEVYHKAIRTDKDLSGQDKPYYHVRVNKHIPEVEE